MKMDITKEAVEKTVREIKSDAVIHCAAWTAVNMEEEADNAEQVRVVRD